MVCLHGFVDTWRTWELVLPALEARHDVFAPTLAGHAGGPPLGEINEGSLADAVERQMDEAGIETAHLVGCSLGGFLALKLAARGRAKSVVAFAPAGGWAPGDESFRDTLAFFTTMQDLLLAAVPHAEAILSTPEGRRRATEFATVNYEHIPADLLAHQMRGAAGCTAAAPLIEYAETAGWELDAEKITCPVRVVWGTADRILPWPVAAARFRNEWLPLADWVVLDNVGHAPQMDIPLEAARLILDFTS
ncbi:MAG TPA: alpha/beta fold hydrolase [Solirubrobacterales bacterium]|nr:alpha/beta fold hydrolase [Solirubrobacterales bacterium]